MEHPVCHNDVITGLAASELHKRCTTSWFFLTRRRMHTKSLLEFSMAAFAIKPIFVILKAISHRLRRLESELISIFPDSTPTKFNSRDVQKPIEHSARRNQYHGRVESNICVGIKAFFVQYNKVNEVTSIQYNLGW